MADAAYFREYRRRNRERLNAQQQTRRNTPEGRAKRAVYRSRPEVRARERALYALHNPLHNPPVPEAHTGHPLFEQARSIVGPSRSTLTTLRSTLHEDLLSEAVLALVEGRDAMAAVDGFRKAEREYGYHAVPLGAWAA